MSELISITYARICIYRDSEFGLSENLTQIVVGKLSCSAKSELPELVAIFADVCRLLLIFDDFCTFLPTFAFFCTLPTFALFADFYIFLHFADFCSFCRLLHIFADFCTLFANFPIFSHFLPLLPLSVASAFRLRTEETLSLPLFCFCVMSPQPFY